MTWIYIALTLMNIFFLLRNIVSEQSFRSYAKEAVFVFEDTRTSYKVLRILFAILMGVMVVCLVVTIVTLGYEVDTLLMELCLISISALMTFVPYSPARFVVTAEGVFLFNYNLFIPWSEMIGTTPSGARKKCYLILHLSAPEANRVKKQHYPLLVPAERLNELQSMIREFIRLEDERRRKLRHSAEKASR